MSRALSNSRAGEIERLQLEQRAARAGLTEREADRLAELSFTAHHRGFRRYPAPAARATLSALQSTKRKARAR